MPVKSGAPGNGGAPGNCGVLGNGVLGDGVLGNCGVLAKAGAPGKPDAPGKPGASGYGASGNGASGNGAVPGKGASGNGASGNDVAPGKSDVLGKSCVPGKSGVPEPPLSGEPLASSAVAKWFPLVASGVAMIAAVGSPGRLARISSSATTRWRGIRTTASVPPKGDAFKVTRTPCRLASWLTTNSPSCSLSAGLNSGGFVSRSLSSASRCALIPSPRSSTSIAKPLATVSPDTRTEV